MDKFESTIYETCVCCNNSFERSTGILINENNDYICDNSKCLDVIQQEKEMVDNQSHDKNNVYNEDSLVDEDDVDSEEYDIVQDLNI